MRNKRNTYITTKPDIKANKEILSEHDMVKATLFLSHSIRHLPKINKFVVRSWKKVTEVVTG